MTSSYRTVFVLCCLTVLHAMVTCQEIPQSAYQELRWRMIGPFRGGRTRAATGVPSQPNVFYMAQVNGGVWKSDDFGRTWDPIFDSQPTQSIGDIAIAAADPNIIYVGSGEGLHRPDLSVGNGIYKSTDGGKTWTHLGLRDAQQITAVVVDPRDPNRVFAAVLGHPYGPSQTRGIFRSTDGGQAWQKILAKDENTGGSAIEMDPTNPDVLYASLWEVREGPWEDNNTFNGSGGGLFKSTDGGNTWHPLNKGLPDQVTQVNVAVSPSRTSRLYATVATRGPDDPQATKGMGFFRSDDGGETWIRITTDPRPATRVGGGGELPVVKVDPKDPDIVYVASIVAMRSTDGGKTWTSFRGAPGGDDYQNLWINPNNPQIILLVSDQGAIVTANGGRSWSSWFNQPTAQLYHAIATNKFPYRVCGGQQESGSVCISSRGNDGEITFRDWHPVGVIEYGYVAPDPLDPDVIYGAGRSEVSRFHWSTGQVQNVTPIPVRDKKYRTDRTEPIVFSPLDPHTMYYAANVIFKTTTGGNEWETISPDLTRTDPGTPASVGKLVSKVAEQQRGVVYALSPSFKNVNTLWAGTDDGQVWVTRDGGKNWSNITPPELIPWSKVTQLQSSHFDDQSAYASVSRFRIDDLRPYIYRTHDGGKTWQAIVNGLPAEAPVDTVREDPVRKGLLFAGTENAVWVSFDDGDHWQSLQQNLPHTAMRDLWIQDNDLIVGTHGRSFWVLDDITILRELSTSSVNSDVYLYRPAEAFRVQRSTNSDTPIPPDEPTGQNPPDGGIVDYYLSHPASGPVTLEIADEKGRVVRRYSSNDEPDASEEELKKQPIPLYWIRMPKTLSATQGMHRWIWDLHYAAPASARYEYPISAVPHDTPRLPLGPTALPGQYTVRLTVNGKTLTAPMKVTMDPRVKIPFSGLAQQFDLETRLASTLTRSSQALLEARSVREQVRKLTTQAHGPVSESLKAAEAKLAAFLQAEANPSSPAAPTLTSLTADLSGLYTSVGQADAMPTVAQVDSAATLDRNLDPLLKQWEEIKASDLASLNRQLHETGMPEIKPQSKTRVGESDTEIE